MSAPAALAMSKIIYPETTKVRDKVEDDGDKKKIKR